MINFYNIGKQNIKYENDYFKKFREINKLGKYILGKNSKDFEVKFSRFTKSKYCIVVGNCLDAIRLTFEAYKILKLLKEGDEVIVPGNTYIATILGISQSQLKPVLVDPDPLTFNISLNQVKKVFNKKTKAILAVDLYGYPADLLNIKRFARKNKILLLEDAAQAHGARIANKVVGSISDATFFSFFPGKNLGAFGDAGAITTSNKKLRDVLCSIRNYGEEYYSNLSNRKYKNKYIGFNSRLDELQAVILNLKLKSFFTEQAKRTLIADYYLKNIKNKKIQLPFIDKKHKAVHAWHLFVVRCNVRNKLKKYLQKFGIQTMIHYPIPPHKQVAYKNLIKNKLPITENLSKTILSLPLNTTLKFNQIKYLVKIINKF
jgi:dTDP-4-amino-4,6-dideoxygalactose transaminase